MINTVLKSISNNLRRYHSKTWREFALGSLVFLSKAKNEKEKHDP